MNAIVMRGVAGEIRWSYHRAATLGTWTIDAGRLTATILQADPFALSQQPLTFVVVRPKGIVWRWGLREVQREGSSLQATLVPEEDY